jgi:hypothetical protein
MAEKTAAPAQTPHRLCGNVMAVGVPQFAGQLKPVGDGNRMGVRFEGR